MPDLLTDVRRLRDDLRSAYPNPVLYDTAYVALDRLDTIIEAHEGDTSLSDALDAAAKAVNTRLLELARPHDAKGFSATGDAYATAARVVATMLANRAAALRDED